MNSGRSAGRHDTSRSFRMWFTMPWPSFTPGADSWFMKCRGTLTWILSLADTRWKSTCSTSGLNGCIWNARSSAFSDEPPTSRSRIDEWNASFFRACHSAL
ncbi:hypothetical protein D3C85_1639470 [compost metagenome]